MDGSETPFLPGLDSDMSELLSVLKLALESELPYEGSPNKDPFTIDKLKEMVPDEYAHLRKLIDKPFLSLLAIYLRDENLFVALTGDTIKIYYIYPGY
jgi:hypothetical protein